MFWSMLPQCTRGLPNMTDYNWCHGPECHKNQTQDRIRGVKGSKVLRTKKIAENNWNRNNVGHIFVVKVVGMILCTNIGTSLIRLHPRTECLETPIEDPRKETIQSNWGNYSWTKTVIKEVDNA